MAELKSMYVVMSTFRSQIVIAIPSPKFIFANRKAAQNFCEEHNAKRTTSTHYYIRKAELK